MTLCLPSLQMSHTVFVLNCCFLNFRLIKKIDKKVMRQGKPFIKGSSGKNITVLLLTKMPQYTFLLIRN